MPNYRDLPLKRLLSSEVYVLLLLGVDERDKIVRFLNWK